MSEELDNDYALKILVISLVLYIITRYFDKKHKYKGLTLPLVMKQYL